ncbi:MAG: hypothetical protein EOP47_20805 [Sphingobacteriaceae bacterium]|nr:MAG: hypothetical protein EOP47_20805 [Sphingobacteriaceae bacterium]
MKLIKPMLCGLLLAALASCSKDKSPGGKLAALTEFSIEGTASSAYFTTPNNATPAIENDQAKAFISLSDKRSYTRAQALADQSKMDIVLGTSYYQQPGTPGAQPNGSVGLEISSTADGSGWQAQSGGREMADFTHRKLFYMAKIFNTKYVDVKTSGDLDKAFEELEDEDFDQRNALIDRYGIEVLTNTLVFKTQEGKKGIMRLDHYNPNKPFIYGITFKMEK